MAYQNHKSRSFRVVEVFRKDPFLALYYSLFSSMIFLFLCFLPSAALFMLTIWLFGPPPPRFELRWSPHKKRWSEYWRLHLNPSADMSNSVIISTRTNMRPPFQWIPTKFNSRLRFNPTPTFLGVTFDRTLSFSKHVCSLKAKLFSVVVVVITPPLPRDGGTAQTVIQIHVVNQIEIRLGERWQPILNYSQMTGSPTTNKAGCYWWFSERHLLRHAG